jgi:hypothetical protein
MITKLTDLAQQLHGTLATEVANTLIEHIANVSGKRLKINRIRKTID